MHQNYASTVSIAREHHPNWDFYFCEVDEKPAIISVDLDLADNAPMTDMPYLVFVSLKLKNASTEGLPLPSELGTLCRIEDHLLQMIEKRATAMFCGRVTNNGCRDLIFYAKNPKSALLILTDAMREFPDYTFETGWKDDGVWDMYFNFLFPNENELNAIINQRNIMKLERENGTKLGLRKIVHRVVLASVDERDSFILKAIDAYFSVESVEKCKKSISENWVVCVSRIDEVVFESVNNSTNQLLDYLKPFGGKYEGWKVDKSVKNVMEGMKV